MPVHEKASLSMRNRILAALPRQDYQNLLNHLEPVSVTRNQSLYESGEPIKYAYFLTSGVVSLLWTTAKGVTVEVAMVGSEGMVGIPIILGAETMPMSAVVQIAGKAMRMKATAIKEEFRRGSLFHDLLLRYTQALSVQVSLSVVCNRLHTLEERLCRWLLMIHDRAETNELMLTHEFIAGMLGVRRSGVTIAARLLQNMGLIRYTRGRITILNRQGLESVSCECYRIGREEFDCFLAFGQ